MARMKRNARRGTSIVEAAFMIPLMLLLIFGALESGCLLHVRHTMTTAAREAARMLAVQGGSISDAQQVALAQLPNADSFDYEFNANAPLDSDLDRDVTVTITVPYSQAALGDFFNLYGSGLMRVAVTMRSEE
ncbi:MAG: pilus assembly protein [Phycisphaeraceae bacterium]|nr:MAG: pilus assembly protein [Phycisphaeraceae bacterium]